MDDVAQVTVDTQEEHEVAEALFCLANIKVGEMKGDGRVSPRSKRKGHQSRKAFGISKRKSVASRRLMQDDASYSSGSCEKQSKPRARPKAKNSNTPFQTMFREGGRRVYHPQSKSTEQPIRRHVIHQQPARVRQKQPVRVETTTPERVMLNARHAREEERPAVPEEQYLPVAVMDALKGIYGRGLICTVNDEPKALQSAMAIKKLDANSHVHPIQARKSLFGKFEEIFVLVKV